MSEQASPNLILNKAKPSLKTAFFDSVYQNHFSYIGVNLIFKQKTKSNTDLCIKNFKKAIFLGLFCTSRKVRIKTGKIICK